MNIFKKLSLVCCILLTMTLAFAETNVKVQPMNKKQPSGVYVNAGDAVKITVSGAWTLWDQYKLVDGNGHKDFVVNDFGAWGALLGKIGSYEFAINNGIEFTSEVSGVLYLYPNKDKYVIENASGELDVTIEGGISVDEFKANLAVDGTRMSFDPQNGILNTDIKVAAGQSLKVYAFGEWTMWDGIYPEVSAAGHDFVAKDASWGKLYGVIGTSYGVGKQTFPIGEMTEIVANADGFLTLYPNISNYVAIKNGTLDIIIVGGEKVSSENAVAKDEVDVVIQNDFQNSILAKVNEYRRECTIADLSIDARLTSTAFGHAKYMSVNSSFSKNEDETKAEFMGMTFTDRLKSVSFEGKAREMFCQSEMTDDVVRVMFDSIYHRLRFMSPLIKTMGYGIYRSGENTLHVFDFGYMTEEEEAEYVASGAMPATVCYPASGATGVKPSWNGVVNPNPFPEGTTRPLGTPVSILFTSELKTEVESTLTDADGNAVECFVISPDKDINNKNLNGITIVPKAPLAPNTKYVATYTVKLGAVEDNQVFTVEFTTGE